MESVEKGCKMGLFDRLFGRKGTPVGSDTVVKRMAACERDFEGTGRDEQDHPSNVFSCGDVANTIGGKTRVRRLYPCRESVAAACVRLKKEQADMFYLSPSPFSLEFSWRNGGRVKMTASFDRSVQSLPDWLMANIRKPGENVTAEALGRLLDGKFSSDCPPDWLVVADREDVAEPEPSQEPPEQTIADLKPGAVVFGNYKIEKELGSGGQGMVFLATDTQTVVEAHRRVVLKVLRCENCGDEASMQEFITEANTLSSLRDDRIAACYWCKRLGNVPILAMEYIEGISLDKYLADQEDGKIGEQDTRELLMPIAEALDYAHAKGIFHRDVKPQNIIVRATPKKIGDRTIRTCLLDFGIASRDHGGNTQTTFRSVRGTIQYMSPEQQIITRKPSASMDIYSLAVTAYECLAGEMPYPDGWDRNFKVTPLASDSSFVRSVMRGLEMLPENRPATCRKLIDPPKDITPVSQAPSDPPKKIVFKVKSHLPSERPITPPVEDLSTLAKSFIVYRQMLAQSAQKCERNNQTHAEWLRGRQAELRDLTRDLGSADAGALERFFIGVRGGRGEMSAEDIFAATDRLVELEASLPDKGGKVLRAIKDSIGK